MPGSVAHRGGHCPARLQMQVDIRDLEGWSRERVDARLARTVHAQGHCETRSRRFRSRRMTVSAVLVASTLLSNGCSFALIERAPDQGYARGAHVRCTRAYGLPVLDTAITAGWAAGAVASFGKDPSDDGVAKVSYTLAGVAAVVVAVPFLISAAYGYVEVADCNAAAAAGSVAVVTSATSERRTVAGRQPPARGSRSFGDSP